MQPPSREKLERAKRASLGQLLLKAARLYDERARARLRDLGGPAVKPAHMRMLPHLDLAGTRVTELARRMDITKQAVGQLADEMRALGLVEIAPDPDDGRAKLVRFSKRGLHSMMTGLEALAAVEAELEATVGKRALRELQPRLEAVLRGLEALATGATGAPPPAPARR